MFEGNLHEIILLIATAFEGDLFVDVEKVVGIQVGVNGNQTLVIETNGFYPREIHGIERMINQRHLGGFSRQDKILDEFDLFLALGCRIKIGE